MSILSSDVVASICPTCKRTFTVDPTSPRPARFCSERCKTIDLGNWLSGAYRVGAPIGEDDELDQGAPSGNDSDSSTN